MISRTYSPLDTGHHHERCISHLVRAVGQDPSFRILSSDRRSVHLSFLFATLFCFVPLTFVNTELEGDNMCHRAPSPLNREASKLVQSGLLLFLWMRHDVLSLSLCSPNFHTSVSLQQMVLFGQHPSQGTLSKASQFLAGELSTRLSPPI